MCDAVHEDERISVIHATDGDGRRIETSRCAKGIDTLHGVKHLTQIRIAALLYLLSADDGDTRRCRADLLGKPGSRYNDLIQLIERQLCLFRICMYCGWQCGEREECDCDMCAIDLLFHPSFSSHRP